MEGVEERENGRFEVKMVGGNDIDDGGFKYQ